METNGEVVPQVGAELELGVFPDDQVEGGGQLGSGGICDLSLHFHAAVVRLEVLVELPLAQAGLGFPDLHRGGASACSASACRSWESSYEFSNPAEAARAS